MKYYQNNFKNGDTNLLTKHKYYNNLFFAKWANLYDYEKYFLFPIRRKAAYFLNDNISFNSKVIDIATGTGALAYEIAKLGHYVTGIDLSPEMLDQAKKKITPGLKLEFSQADGTKLPYKDNVFDASTISWGLHDMPYEIGLQVISEIKRVTNKNGKILFVDYMEPQKNRLAHLAHKFISLYETPMYQPFIRKGLDHYLRISGLASNKKTDFLGIIQIVLAVNRK